MSRWTKPQMWAFVVLIACAIAVFCIASGYHGANVCAIESPHDGQCGMEVMGGYLAAIVLFPGAIVLGAIAIAWVHSRRKS